MQITRKLILSYLLTCVVFFAIDLTRLGLVAKDLYQRYLKDFLSPQVNRTAAMIFYFIYIVGIMIFAVYPAVEKWSRMQAALLWWLFWFFTYATYDLTNLATLKNRPIQIVFIDILWGTVLCSLVSIAWFYLVRRIG